PDHSGGSLQRPGSDRTPRSRRSFAFRVMVSGMGQPMSRAVSGSAQHATNTFVAQLMRSKVAVGLLSAAPIPLFLVRPILTRDNARENRKDSWQRLRVRSEAGRYGAVRTATGLYAPRGF